MLPAPPHPLEYIHHVPREEGRTGLNAGRYYNYLLNEIILEDNYWI